MNEQQPDLRDEVAQAMGRLKAVHQQHDFQDLVSELWSKPSGEERQAFVRDVLLTASGSGRLELPPGVTLQRTYFDDDRQTLFALVDHLPTGLPFKKVTITYDDSQDTDAADPGQNPYLANVDSYEQSLDDLLQDPKVDGAMRALPDDDHERVHAVRALTPADITSRKVDGLRVSARWFEHDNPLEDNGAGIRYVFENGYGSPYPRPTPPPTPKPGGGGATVCVSVGAVVCGSVGG